MATFSKISTVFQFLRIILYKQLSHIYSRLSNTNPCSLMGVTFSDSDSTFKNGAIDRNCLRVDKATVEAIVSAFVQHSFPPVGNKDELMSLFHCAVFLLQNSI